MASINPKLEFYRFKLNHKDGFKTFKDYAIDVWGVGKAAREDSYFKKCFEEFMRNLNAGFEENDKLQKTITLISKRSVNKHLDNKPIMIGSKSIFHGVINGGPYGKERILSDIDNKEDSSTIGKKKPVLSYYYIFVYLPPNHNEGFFMVHSNNSDDSITAALRQYIAGLFKSGAYRKPAMEAFCPKKFQEEFNNGATIKNIKFTTSYVDDIPQNDPLREIFNEYTIKIEAIPKKKGVAAAFASRIKDLLDARIYGKDQENNMALSEFDRVSLSTTNQGTKTSKTFEWNSRDAEFVPVVYLENHVRLEDDRTPNFAELKQYCMTLFEETIIHELRPDLEIKHND